MYSNCTLKWKQIHLSIDRTHTQWHCDSVWYTVLLKIKYSCKYSCNLRWHSLFGPSPSKRYCLQLNAFCWKKQTRPCKTAFTRRCVGKGWEWAWWCPWLWPSPQHNQRNWAVYRGAKVAQEHPIQPAIYHFAIYWAAQCALCLATASTVWRHIACFKAMAPLCFTAHCSIVFAFPLFLGSECGPLTRWPHHLTRLHNPCSNQSLTTSLYLVR